ncbi:ADIPOR-like receptor Izh3p [[Candida] anglica]
MSSTFTSVRSGSGTVRNRTGAEAGIEPAMGSPVVGEEEEASTEELLIEKLDRFLRSVETRLDSFEQYLKAVANVESEEKSRTKVVSSSGNNFLSPESAETTKQRSSRRSSTASIGSITSYSLGNLKSMYSRLGMIKASVLRSSVSNLEHLYINLEEHYQYLTTFGSDGEHPLEPELEAVTSNTAMGKEMLSAKILNTIQFFDEKFTQVDHLIQDRTPRAKDEYQEATFRHFKYFNFNKALKSAETRDLHYYELPLNWRENRYIIQGYRFTLKHKSILGTIFRFNHNESINIWTHMAGIWCMVYLALWHFPRSAVFAANSTRDNWVVYIFLLAAIECFTSSVIWHTYSGFARYKTRSTCACIDYTGITVLITASIIAAEYCSLYHHPTLLRTYIVFSSLCGGTGFLFNWSPYFDRPECRSLRIGFFMGLAFLGASTFVCSCFFEGFIYSLRFFIPLVYKSFVWYWIGVVFYGGLIPERWRYDVVINEDETCRHTHSPVEVLGGEVEHSGLEELEEIKREISHDMHEEKPKEADEYQDIVDKHFPSQPAETRYHRDFFSLWWVDYILSSHNIWHVCVLLGVLGHYVCVLDMFEKIVR